MAANNCVGQYREYPGSYDVTILNLFGLYAVSMGSSELMSQVSPDNPEIIERSGYKYYYRFLMREGRLVGAQLVGNTGYGGSLLSAIVRRDDMSNIKNLITCRGLALIPLMRVANNYLRREIKPISSD